MSDQRVTQDSEAKERYKGALLPIPATTTRGTEELVTGIDRPKIFRTSVDLSNPNGRASGHKTEASRTAFRRLIQADKGNARAGRTGAVRVHRQITMMMNQNVYRFQKEPESPFLPGRRYTI
jgi:hypothetical protein